MNTNKDNSMWLEKLGFYYNYFGKKKDIGIDNLTTMQIAKETNKSKANISNDLTKLVDSPGRRNYGYNTIFLYRELQKTIKLNNVCNLLVIGELSPFIHTNLLNNRNFYILKQTETYNKDLLLTNADILVLTKEINEDDFAEISETVSAILNLSGKSYTTEKPYYEIDFLAILTALWIDSLEDIDVPLKKD